jgi:hypothetical protein
MRKQASLAAATEQSEGQIARIMAAPPDDSSSTVLEWIERVALDPRADVEKLDRMMAMYERLKAKEAELAFNAVEGPDPEKARRHQNRQEQVRGLRN